MVFAQKTIPIGTIGIAQVVAARARGRVVVPAAGRDAASSWQVVGIADRDAAGLLGLPRAEPARRAGPRALWREARRHARRDCAPRGVGPVELGDEVGGGLHPPVGARRRGRGPRRRRRPSAAMRASASRAKTSTGASSSRRASSRIAASRSSAPRTPSAASIAASRHSPSAACSPPPACAVPRGRRLERRPRPRRLPERAQDPPEVHPGERRQAHVAGGLGLVDRELQRGRAGRRSRRPGTAPGRGSTTWYASVCRKPSRPRRLRGATEVDDGVVEPVLDPGQLAEHRLAADVQPRVVDRAQPVLRPDRAPRRCAPGRRPRSRLGRRRASSRPGPTAGPARRRARRLRSVSSIAWRNSPWCDTT